MSHLTIYIDYLCPYVHRALEWHNTLQVMQVETPPVAWRFFSLVQVNHRLRDGWQIWDQPALDPSWEEQDSARSLRFFWAAAAAGRQGDDALMRFQLALVRAIHVDKAAVDTWDALEAIAVQSDLDLGRYDADRRDVTALARLAADHKAGVDVGVFGTPTFVFDNATPAYLKLARVLDEQAAQAAWLAFRNVAQDQPAILEIKRPQ
jgi:hypothetical protein